MAPRLATKPIPLILELSGRGSGTTHGSVTLPRIFFGDPHPMTPTPKSAPSAVTALNTKNTFGRRILWVVISAALGAPPILLFGYLWGLNENHHFNWPWLIQHMRVVVTAGLVSAGLAWLGLQRDWYQRPRLLWGLSITAAAGLGLVVFFVQLIEHILRVSQDKAALSTLRQIQSAADQYYQEYPMCMAASLGHGGSDCRMAPGLTRPWPARLGSTLISA